MTSAGRFKTLRETVKNINTMIDQFQRLNEKALILINEMEPPVISGGLPETGQVYLSPREISVIRLVGQGKHNNEIARDLAIKEGYVRAIVSRLYDKLEIHDRGGLILYAIRAGFVTVAQPT